MLQAQVSLECQLLWKSRLSFLCMYLMHNHLNTNEKCFHLVIGFAVDLFVPNVDFDEFLPPLNFLLDCPCCPIHIFVMHSNHLLFYK